MIPLEKGMATHSNILAWRIPQTEEPGGLQGHKESDTTEQLKHTHAPVVLLCRKFLTKQTHFSLQLTAFWTIIATR